LYLIDYHVHTKRCGHAQGEDRQFVEAAIAKGLKEIGFADHVPCYYADYPEPTGAPVHKRGMAAADLDGYVQSVLRLKAEYTEIEVKLGLEIDFAPGWEEPVNIIIKQYPWDYVLGSVHFIAEWNFGYIIKEQGRSAAEIFKAYYKRVAETAESRLFDAIVHVDLPKRAFKPLAPEVMNELYQSLAIRLGRARTVMEINTRGVYDFFKTKDGIDPDPHLLRLCRQHGVGVILGSDSHRPEEVGSNFADSVELLSLVGFDRLTVFNRRQASQLAWQK
jgi:histidinol-phosphatase (PHP family)